ncbi:unnamed protein product [Candida verbasci]|uniref:Peptidase A1 domain-containing protein n=1 Tax=Candida verbasci TaxID=1227364 RepID=A0A9W4XIF0_9ASCO|nr:unnamed protein product [Candida verbasci]
MFYMLLTLVVLYLVSSEATAINNQFQVVSLDLKRDLNNQKRDGFVGTADLTHEAYYSVEVEVGSNKDKILVAFDTGSSNAHIPDKNIICNGNCVKWGVFDANSSTTLQRFEMNVTSAYGGGSYSARRAGQLVTDDFTIGDISLKHFPFVDDNYAKDVFQGILGMGHSTPKERNVAWTAFEQGVISKPAYSFYIGDSDFPGQVHLGGYDAAKLDGEFSWTSIKGSNIGARGNYMIVNGKNITIDKRFTVDSGWDRGCIPDPAYSEFFTAFPDEQAYNQVHHRLNCTALKGKTFQYSINGRELTLPMKSLVSPGQTGEQCYTSFTNCSTPQLGAFLFRYMYVAVDFERDVIGFGQLKQSSETNLVSF